MFLGIATRFLSFSVPLDFVSSHSLERIFPFVVFSHLLAPNYWSLEYGNPLFFAEVPWFYEVAQVTGFWLRSGVYLRHAANSAINCVASVFITALRLHDEPLFAFIFCTNRLHFLTSPILLRRVVINVTIWGHFSVQLPPPNTRFLRFFFRYFIFYLVIGSWVGVWGTVIPLRRLIFLQSRYRWSPPRHLSIPYRWSMKWSPLLSTTNPLKNGMSLYRTSGSAYDFART